MSPRPYKEPWDIEQAAAEIEKGAGSQFDPTVVEAFLNILRRGDFNDHIESSRAGTNLRTGQNS